jgi:hypothetical protein
MRGILGDLGGIVRRVGDADAGNELCHSQLRACSLGKLVFPRQMAKRKSQYANRPVWPAWRQKESCDRAASKPTIPGTNTSGRRYDPRGFHYR